MTLEANAKKEKIFYQHMFLNLARKFLARQNFRIYFFGMCLEAEIF